MPKLRTNKTGKTLTQLIESIPHIDTLEGAWSKNPNKEYRDISTIRQRKNDFYEFSRKIFYKTL